ncbi:hypothetical protein [Janthinobacterium svalbardensis]|uniref:hypothetical protein n=1 Tax=Janthinobacterium svalbardensis TaxID=368607 RepID=UPI002FCDD0DD
MNSFALASSCGTPASYQHLGEYLQLNYGSEAAGCRLPAARSSCWSTSNSA